MVPENKTRLKKKLDPENNWELPVKTRLLSDGEVDVMEASATPLDLVVVALRPILVLIWSGPFFS